MDDPQPRLGDGFAHLTLSRGIRCSARRVPDKKAIVAGSHSITYSQLVERMDRLASAAQSLWQLVPGDVVALIAPNCPEYLEAVCALSDAGLLVATLNPYLTPGELSTIIEDCKPKRVVMDGQLASLCEHVRNMSIPVTLLGEEYEVLLAEASGAFVAPDIAEWSGFSISYTSGTTGKPKGVQLPHRSRALMFMAMDVEYGCFGMDDRFLALAPLYHGAGFAFAAAAISFGGTCVLFGSSKAEDIVSRLAEGDITGIFMVPTHFSRLFDLPDDYYDGFAQKHGLKTIISNAAALPQVYKEKTVSLFGEGLLHETYGSTEGGIVTNIRPDSLLRKPGSVGTAFVQMEVEVRNDDGEVCGPGEIGELFCRGPYTFNGYLNKPEETSATIQDGWVTVQDLATVDQDGFITICGRKKDMIVSGGVNIYPAEIEAVISNMPAVDEAAVVGLPDDEWGERIHAFVVQNRNQKVSESDILSACREQLSRFKVPRGVSFIDQLPKNPTGKLLKRELRIINR